jgi:hypothetical protein
MDIIDRFQIIEPKVFPLFILEKTLINMEVFNSFSSYIRWLGQIFAATERNMGTTVNVQLIYCLVVPVLLTPMEVRSKLSLSSEMYIAESVDNNYSPQLGNYSGRLLFDIPQSTSVHDGYLCLVKKDYVDPRTTIPRFDEGNTRKVLTGIGVDSAISYSWQEK